MIKCTKAFSKNVLFAALAGCLPLLITSCSFQKYTPKTINPIANAVKFEQKNPESAPFQQYLVNNGYAANSLPLQQWNVDDLTYCALYFHPSLDVARAQWRLAESAEASSAEKPVPILNGHLANSNRANQDISPFAFGLSIDIPIETANKRDIRIENARHLSQAAKLDVAQTAWQLRNQVAQSLNEYQFNLQQIHLLTDEESRRQEIVAIYQKRVNVGAASNVELSTAKLQLQTATSELNAKKQNKLVLLAKLANSLGLPLAKVEAMHFVVDTDLQKVTDFQTDNLQTAALLNRLDIRIALERYAAVEAKLKLEIAKQYPNLVISPGYAYEFGDKIWSLGLSGLLTLLNKNKLGIAAATQLREVEVVQFEALQSKVIAEASIANAELTQAQQVFINQQKLREKQQSNAQRMERKFSAGEIDRLELSFNKLENIAADKNVALAQFQLQTMLTQLENVLQEPLLSMKTQTKNNTSIEDLSFKKPTD